jgi:sigma-E factor negative regulatory protein RseC
MLEETARVIALKGGLLIAETESRSACSHCSSGVCGTATVAKLFGVRRNRLVLENSLDARPGDRVVLCIGDDLLVRASVTAYLLPLLSMLGAAVLGDVLGTGEGFVGLLALAGLASGFLLVRWMIRRGSAQRYRPRLSRIVAREPGRIEIPILTRS